MIILGIDAAWTAAQPSGVALVVDRRCVRLAPSYESFVAGVVDWRVKPRGGPADCDALIETVSAIAGAPPDVIAVDMPLATKPIVARRAADNAIASAFARFGLGVHTPNPERPGPIADGMYAGFAARGYRLACKRRIPKAMIEVFPHAAAIALTGADYRVPYKLARAAQYWPALSQVERRRAITNRWRAIRRGLAADVDGVALRVPSGGPLAQLKRYEDALDAAICAWVGIEYLAGRAMPHGDHESAVWATPV